MERGDHNCEDTDVKLSNNSSTIWSLIDSRSRKMGEEEKRFFIQSIPEGRYEEALDFLCDYYIPDEPICQYMNIQKDQSAIDDFRNEWRNCLRKGISVGVFLSDQNVKKSEMVGVNVLYVGTKESDAEDIRKKNFASKKAEKMVKMFYRVQNEADIHTKYGTEIYIGAIGLSVHPHYRGHGLAKYILDARNEIGRQFNIPLTVTNFTGPHSQLAAERAGFEVLFEQKYNEMLDDNGELTFPLKTPGAIKVMGKRLY